MPRYVQLGCDTARRGHDMVRREQGRSAALARGPGWWGVSRYNRLYRDRREAWSLGVESQYRYCMVAGGDFRS